VAAGEDGEKRVLHHLFLAEDNLGDFRADRRNVGQRLFGRGDDRLFIEGFAGIHHAHVALLIPSPLSHLHSGFAGRQPERILRCI
jgi:hypothetical protein